MPATLLFWVFPFAFSWGFFLIAIIPYFLPTIIAILRKSTSTAGIFVLNFFLGWTFIGWIVALVWAIASRNTSTTIVVNNTYQSTYPANGGQSYGPPTPTHQTSPTIRRNNPNA